MPDKIRTEPITISTFDVGASGKLEAAALMRHFQEAAARHATQWEVGFEQLSARNIFWVLTHLQIKAERWPEMHDKVTIQTWPKKVKGLYTTRDFEVFDKTGKIIIKATSAWVMVDTHNKRPVRPAGIMPPRAFVPDKNTLDPFPEAIPEPDKTDSVIERQVQYSDLDINRHVNNTRYVEWIMDLINPGIHEIVSGLNLHFTSEFTAGDKAILQLSQNPESNKQQVSIKHHTTGKTGCRALIEIKLYPIKEK